MLILYRIYLILIVYFMRDSFVNLVHFTMVRILVSINQLVNETLFFFAHLGNYIKDLSRLGRDTRKVIIIDNSPLSYLFHQDNAVRIAELTTIGNDMFICLFVFSLGSCQQLVWWHTRYWIAHTDPNLWTSCQCGWCYTCTTRNSSSTTHGLGKESFVFLFFPIQCRLSFFLSSFGITRITFSRFEQVYIHLAIIVCIFFRLNFLSIFLSYILASLSRRQI